MSNLLLDEIPFDDLVKLRREADRIAASEPNEAERRRTTLRAQQKIKKCGKGATAALLELEQATSASLVAAVDDALRLGSRYGRARAVVDLDGDEQELLVEIAGLGLDLKAEQRLRVLVAALRLEVG